MDKRSKPPGKIFQPEIAAQAVLRAAAERPRELWVGGPAVRLILAQRVAPGLADWLTAKQAYHQHSQKPDPDSRPDNLFETVDWDKGAHGRFDSEALSSSMQQQLSRNAGLLALGALALGASAGLVWSRRAQRGDSTTATAKLDDSQRSSCGSELAEDDGWMVPCAAADKLTQSGAPAARA